MNNPWFRASLTALILLAGCAGQQQALTSADTQPMLSAAHAPPIAQLPPFPQDRHTSAPFVAELDGKDTFDRSLNAIDGGTAVELISGLNEISWGIWKFHPGMEVVSSVQVVLTLPPDDDVAYIALADYSANAWEFRGPVTVGGSFDLVDAKHRSSLGNTYVAVITAEGHSATVHKLILTSASDWAIVTVDDGGAENVGANSSLLVVNGSPAICYGGDLYYGKLRYVRATDSEGISWGSPMVFVDGWARFTSMAILALNALPAICYFTGGSFGTLDYVRATDANGEAWASPLTVAQDYSVEEAVGLHPSLALNKQSRPAIAYYDDESWSLYYICALNESGDSWDTAETAVFGGLFSYITLAMDMNGNPLISYYNEEFEILQIVGMNTAGTDWNPPQTVDAEGDVGQYASGANVGWGDMAISYYDATNCHLKYASYNLEHSEWQSITVDSGEDVGLYTSLEVIDGKPAISYYDQANGDLKYVRADDASGTSWGTPVIVDSIGDVGLCTSLAEVDGRPAISYYDSTNGDLKYAIFRGP